MESPGERITMVHPDLGKVPGRHLTPGLEVRWYQSGDEDEWVRIHELADRYNTASLKLYADEFTDEGLSLEDRQFYLVDRSGQYVATATAWAGTDEKFHGYGRLHWVAVIPGYQNQGIGGMLVSIACQRLVELGYKEAFLTTSTLRPAAIHLYEKFGFRIERESSSGI